MPSQRNPGYTIVPLQKAHVEACCALEAHAFNVLRRKWGQPEQAPRRRDWLTYQVRNHPENCRAALLDEKLIGYSLVHAWGSLGWVGPVVVEPTLQGRGVGSQLTLLALQTLQGSGCQTIGLETWPHHLANIAFYVKAGFNPGPLVVVLEKDVSAAAASFSGRRLTEERQPTAVLDELAELSDIIVPGLDYRPMMQATLAFGMGDVYVWGPDTQLEAAAVVHYEPYSEAPTPEYANAELLIVRPGKEALLGDLLTEMEGLAAYAGRGSIRISLSTLHAGGMRYLLESGYRLRKVRLRMYHSEQSIPAERVNYLSYAV